MSEDLTRSASPAVLMGRIQALVGPALREAEQVFQKELQSPHPFIEEVVTTDTVPPADWPELKVLSTAGLFAEAISRVHAGESISSMFDGVDPTLGPPQPRLPFPA